jgi:hypothetical protein
MAAEPARRTAPRRWGRILRRRQSAVLFVMQLAMWSLMALFHGRLRPTLIAQYRLLAMTMPVCAKVSLAVGFMPGVAAASALVTLLAFVMPRGRRAFVLAWALTLSGFSIVAAALCSFAPLLGG